MKRYGRDTIAKEERPELTFCQSQHLRHTRRKVADADDEHREKERQPRRVANLHPLLPTGAPTPELLDLPREAWRMHSPVMPGELLKRMCEDDGALLLRWEAVGEGGGGWKDGVWECRVRGRGGGMVRWRSVPVEALGVSGRGRRVVDAVLPLPDRLRPIW